MERRPPLAPTITPKDYRARFEIHENPPDPEHPFKVREDAAHDLLKMGRDASR